MGDLWHAPVFQAIKIPKKCHKSFTFVAAAACYNGASFMEDFMVSKLTITKQNNSTIKVEDETGFVTLPTDESKRATYQCKGSELAEMRKSIALMLLDAGVLLAEDTNSSEGSLQRAYRGHMVLPMIGVNTNRSILNKICPAVGK